MVRYSQKTRTLKGSSSAERRLKEQVRKEGLVSMLIKAIEMGLACATGAHKAHGTVDKP